MIRPPTPPKTFLQRRQWNLFVYSRLSCAFYGDLVPCIIRISLNVTVIFSCLLQLVMINWKLIMFRWKGWWSLFQVKTHFHQLSALKTLQIAPKIQMITKGADCNDSNLSNHRSEWNIIRTVNSKIRQYFIESHENSSRFNDWWCNCRISSITWNYHFQ